MNDLRDIEDRLRDATHAYADGIDPASDAWDQITRRTRAASHRRRAIWISATSAVAAAALIAGALLFDHDQTRRVKTPPAATTPTTRRSTPTEAWMPLPRPPLRDLGEIIWTGKEMLGWKSSGREGEQSEGAAYNPSTRTWRRLAPRPGDTRGFVRWTGSRLVQWDPTAEDGRPTVATAYDPARDSWTRLAPGPITSPSTNFVTVSTGKELVVLANPSPGDANYPNPQAAALDPTTGTWRELHGLRDQKNFIPMNAVWDGREAIVTGGRSACPRADSACNDWRMAVMTYDPVADRSREITLPAAEQSLDLTPAAATRDRLLFWSLSGNGSESTWELISYDRSTDTWGAAPPPPCPRTFDAWGMLQDPTNQGFPIWPCPDGTVVWFDTARGDFQELGTEVPFQLTSATGAWTGTELIVLARTEGGREFAAARPLNDR